MNAHSLGAFTTSQIFVFEVMNVVSHRPSTSFFVSCFVFAFFLLFYFLRFGIFFCFLFFRLKGVSSLVTFHPVFALFTVLKVNTKCAWIQAAVALRNRFFAVMGCYVPLIGSQSPTFRHNISFPEVLKIRQLPIKAA
jgi:hypothetical protein